MSESPFEILRIEPLYKSWFRADRFHLRRRQFDGAWSGEFTRELFRNGRASAILLYDPDRDAVVMVEQFRLPAAVNGLDPFLLECAAGLIEAGHEPEETARREALEETGLSVGIVKPIGDFLVSPGAVEERVFLFAAPVDSRVAGGIHGLAHENEEIRVRVIPAAEAIAMARRNELKNAITIIALYWLALNREELRREWGSGVEAAQATP